MIDSLVIEANSMLSALLGGRAREIFFDRPENPRLVKELRHVSLDDADARGTEDLI